jgi:hypothetical protein
VGEDVPTARDAETVDVGLMSVSSATGTVEE